MRFNSLRRPFMVGATAVLSVGGVVALATVVPNAMATGVEDAEREVQRLGHEVEVAAEQYNEVQAQLGPLQEQLQLSTSRQADQQRFIDTTKSQLAQLAVTSYKRGGMDASLALLLSEDPIAFAESSAVVEAMSRSQVASLGEYDAAIEQLAVERAATETKLAEVQALERQSADLKTAIEAQLNGATAVLARAERARATREAAALEASRSRAAVLAAQPTVAGAPGAPAAGSGSSRPVAAGTSCADVGATAPNDRVAAVLDFACAQLGKPYQWAADGPGSYDCSGLTMTAWAQAGVSLPHSSRLQYSNGVKVERANLQPGDLVFSYSPISHVGIYIGNGYVVNAPSTGDVVKVSSIGTWPYSGAVRP